MDAFEKAKQYVEKENYLEVKYEDLCASPVEVFQKVIEFCELPWTENFEKSIKKYRLKNRNDKWQKELTEYQKSVLDGILREYLIRYGYITYNVDKN